MKNILISLKVIFLSLLLVGCEGMQSSTSLVKNGTMNFNKTITIGQAFDNWKDCIDRKWNNFETDNGVKVVEFTCNVQSALDNLPEMKKFFITYINQVKSDPDLEKKVNNIEQLANLLITIQFTLNQDDTFQLDYFGLTWIDKEKREIGKTSGTNGKENVLLDLIYKNEIAFKNEIMLTKTVPWSLYSY